MKEFTVIRSKWLRGDKCWFYQEKDDVLSTGEKTTYCENACRSSLLKRDHNHLDVLGSMCCLGFLAKELGFSDDDIAEVADPVALSLDSHGRHGYDLEEFSNTVNQRFGNKLIRVDVKTFEEDDTPSSTTLLSKIIQTNDDPEMEEVNREELLAVLFAEAGFKITFVD